MPRFFPIPWGENTKTIQKGILPLAGLHVGFNIVGFIKHFSNIDKTNPCGTTNYTPIRISCQCRDSYPTEKCTWLSRLPKKVNNGKRATRMKSAEGSYFRLIFLRQLSWDMLTPKCTNVIKHCTCAVKWASLGRYHQFDSGPTLCP